MRARASRWAWRLTAGFNRWLNGKLFEWDQQSFEPVLESAKRVGVRWQPALGDWFTSLSPRNYNENAEGYWDHWVDLAIEILQHDLTAVVRPDAHAAVQGLIPLDLYNQVNRRLTVEEIRDALRERQ